MRSVHGLILAFAFTGGAFAQDTQPRMGEPLRDLTPAELERFTNGLTSFSTLLTAPQGLGPIFNQQSCASCHSTGGIGGAGQIKVTRFGFADKGFFDSLDWLGGSLLQSQSIALGCEEVVPVEANITAQRTTNALFGMGLVAAIDDADLYANELSPPAGVSGRVHWVDELETPGTQSRAGRFGWKAQLATILSFSADAAQNEMGLTNRILPAENAPNGDLDLLALCDSVPDPEDGPDGNGLHFIDRISDFQSFLAAPPQTPRSGMSGETIFTNIGCAKCHTPEFTTRDDVSLPDALRNKVIKPYSDFLLHDMGISGDFISQGGALETEIRTPSLWGVRVRDPLWHDGRILGGTFESRMAAAIAEHGTFLSEGAASASAFAALSSGDKAKVYAFLDSLGKAEFDSNGDNRIEFNDYTAFIGCFGAAGVTADDACAVSDLDQDGDIDLDDALGFFSVYTGTYSEDDCNNNGFVDLYDFLSGADEDCNANFIADSCERADCPGDLDGSGTVDFDDLNVVLSNWSAPTTCLNQGNADGAAGVDFGDLNVVLSAWGSTCGG